MYHSFSLYFIFVALYCWQRDCSDLPLIIFDVPSSFQRDGRHPKKAILFLFSKLMKIKKKFFSKFVPYMTHITIRNKASFSSMNQKNISTFFLIERSSKVQIYISLLTLGSDKIKVINTKMQDKRERRWLST